MKHWTEKLAEEIDKIINKMELQLKKEEIDTQQIQFIKGCICGLKTAKIVIPLKETLK